MSYDRITQIHWMWLISILKYGCLDATQIWKYFKGYFLQAGRLQHC